MISISVTGPSLYPMPLRKMPRERDVGLLQNVCLLPRIRCLSLADHISCLPMPHHLRLSLLFPKVFQEHWYLPLLHRWDSHLECLQVCHQEWVQCHTWLPLPQPHHLCHPLVLLECNKITQCPCQECHHRPCHQVKISKATKCLPALPHPPCPTLVWITVEAK